jgi:hypothetical protein
MSATRDQSQKVAFVYSNLYQIYQKGKNAAQSADISSVSPAVIPADQASSLVSESAPVVVSKSQILKADDLHKPEFSSVKIAEYNPAAFIGKRVARPQSLPPVQNAQPTAAVSSLKENLKALNDLHSRLRFMLQELEELVKK